MTQPALSIENVQGAIVVTGPSSCGKGEVSKALCTLLSIPPERWLSMGNILRTAYERARNDQAYVAELESRHAISDSVAIFATQDMTDHLREKIASHQARLAKMLAARAGARARPHGWQSATPLDWLEYCTSHGLLVPNRWTQELIAARIEAASKVSPAPIILDGYPRTRQAAEHLLDTLDRAGMPVLKVLHLSISKQEMLHRAGLRGRADDDPAALLQRYEFYIESVQPSVDYMKDRLGAHAVALIDAHQPSYDVSNGVRTLNLRRSIDNVVSACVLALTTK
jgi:adenylate kinase family enzyme